MFHSHLLDDVQNDSKTKKHNAHQHIKFCFAPNLNSNGKCNPLKNRGKVISNLQSDKYIMHST